MSINTVKKTKENSYSYFFQRVLWTRSFFLVFLLLTTLMIWDAVNHLSGAMSPNVFEATFLDMNALLNRTQDSILFTIWPAYIFVGVTKTFLEDYTSGFNHGVISRTGYINYLRKSYIVNFILGFGIFFGPLVLNIIFVKFTQIFLHPHSLQTFAQLNGYLSSYNPNQWKQFLDDPGNSFVIWQMHHEFLAWLIFAIKASLYSGLFAVTMMTFSRIFNRQYQVLIMSVLLYYAQMILFTNNGGIIGKSGIQSFIRSSFEAWLSNGLIIIGVLIVFNLFMHWLMKGEEALLAT